MLHDVGYMVEDDDKRERGYDKLYDEVDDDKSCGVGYMVEDDDMRARAYDKSYDVVERSALVRDGR